MPSRIATYVETGHLGTSTLMHHLFEIVKVKHVTDMLYFYLIL